ncbi:hypothetical protein [Xanthomonas sacchari]|nr:hypothetical protein [Xanthomonas sacchari]
MNTASDGLRRMRQALMRRLPEDAAAVLRNTSLGNEAVSRLEDLVSRD